jgi:hypothetical protein
LRLRRRANGGGSVTAITTAVVILIVFAWVMVTMWYLTWGLLLVPYRLARRGARKRKVEELRGHLLSGRLTDEEFEEWVSAAQRARTHADLDGATIHLPHNAG